jgi:D-alanyl-D-alanine dipeptidase
MTLLSDTQITIHTADNREPLIDLRDVSDLWLDGRRADGPGAFARLRASVVERLVDAQAGLPRGVRLLIVEGYRPRHLRDSYLFGYQAERPESAAHGTGGAVDLTLCTDDGVELDLGTGVNESPEATANACRTAARNIAPVALRNRAVLWTALRAVGLTNYPAQWWHWSYGDRYWALSNGLPNTLYGEVVSSMS